VQYIGIDN